MTTNPTWRGDAGEHEDPRRTFIRNYVPAQGQVFLDLDLVQRTYGTSYGLDHKGRFRLFELKKGDAGLTGGQSHTFGLIDEMLRRGDDESRYDGIYVVKTASIDWENETTFTVNRVKLNRDEFIGFLKQDSSIWIEPLELGRNPRTF